MKPDDMVWSHTPAARPAPAYPEDTLWTVTKGTRTARAVVRRLPHGKDLVYFVDDELMQSQLFPLDGDQALLAAAEDKRQAFIARGWA